MHKTHGPLPKAHRPLPRTQSLRLCRATWTTWMTQRCKPQSTAETDLQEASPWLTVGSILLFGVHFSALNTTLAFSPSLTGYVERIQ